MLSFSFGIDLTLVFVSQRFARQKTEDGQDPSAKWGADLLVADTEDPDDEDNICADQAQEGARCGSGRLGRRLSTSPRWVPMATEGMG